MKKDAQALVDKWRKIAKEEKMAKLETKVEKKDEQPTPDIPYIPEETK